MNLFQSFRNKTCRKIFGLGIINTDEEGCTQIIPWCSDGNSWRISCCRQPFCTKDDFFFKPWNVVVNLNNFEKNNIELRKLIFISFTLINYIFDWIMLAAVHFNENGMREQATTKEGKKDMTSCFPSIKKGGGEGIHTSESESGVYIW